MQGLANTAWAFSKLGHDDGDLLDGIAAETESRIASFNAQNLANTVCSQLENLEYLAKNIWAACCATA